MKPSLVVFLLVSLCALGAVDAALPAEMYKSLPSKPITNIAGTVEQDFILFSHFETAYRRTYLSMAEKSRRFDNFRASLRRVDANNKAQVAAGGEPVFGITKFSDWSEEEIRTRLLPGVRFEDERGNFAPRSSDGRALEEYLATAPKDFDWREKGAITRVRNQGTKCGSCWAFSAIQTIESFWYLAKRGPLMELSAQQLVSCDKASDACRGGFPMNAYRYVSKAGGVASEKLYPYVSGLGEVPPCQFNTSMVTAKIDGFSWAESDGNEANLVKALVEQGPLSVCIDAHHWADYKSGVITSCGTWIDHCVQLVGYRNNPNATSTSITGTSSNGSGRGDTSSYYIVKNSWDDDWGEKGYINLRMGGNMCGIATRATYVRVNSP